jgi:Mn2+/Fe2+ NRAMP family transporter
VLDLPQHLCDELGGLIDGQALTDQVIEDPPVDLNIFLLFDVEITYMALDVYKIVIIAAGER